MLDAVPSASEVALADALTLLLAVILTFSFKTTDDSDSFTSTFTGSANFPASLPFISLNLSVSLASIKLPLASALNDDFFTPNTLFRSVLKTLALIVTPSPSSSAPAPTSIAALLVTTLTGKRFSSSAIPMSMAFRLILA